MATSSDATTTFASINNIDIHHEVSGSGPALVFLHAGIADLRMWDDQVQAFRATHRTIRYDLRGFGQTGTADGPYSHHNDLAALVDHLDIESAIVVGASFGGRVAIDFALVHPERVKALVLVGAALGGYPFSDALDASDAEIEAAYEAGDLDGAATIDVRDWIDGPFRTADEVDPAFRARASQLARGVYDTAEPAGTHQPIDPPANNRLAELTVPTLIIVGSLDQPDILRIADRLATQVTGARRAFIDNTTHLPNMEQPNQFNAILREFLDHLSAPPVRGVSLREIDHDNWRAVVDLELDEQQRAFMESNAISIAESRFHPWMLPLAIYNDDEVIGFVMYSQSPDPREGNYWVHRFMIDRRHQGKGHGTAAMHALLARIRQHHPACSTLWIGYDAANTPAQHFYARLGFIEQGLAPWGDDLCAKIELG